MAYVSSVASSDGPVCWELRTTQYLSDKYSRLLEGAILATFWSFNLRKTILK